MTQQCLICIKERSINDVNDAAVSFTAGCFHEHIVSVMLCEVHMRITIMRRAMPECGSCTDHVCYLVPSGKWFALSPRRTNAVPELWIMRMQIQAMEGT